MASLLVYFSHISGFTGGYLWQLGGFGHDAVCFFFVLSGYVIAWVSGERENKPLDYITNRLARIYSVALPALVLTIVSYYVGNYINVHAFQELNEKLTDPITTIGSALFFVNQSWWDIIVFSNGPYWSLGHEVLYYAFFGILIFTTGSLRIVYLLLMLLIMGPSVILYLPIWMLGVATYMAQSRIRLNYGWALFIFTSTIFLLVVLRVSVVRVFLNKHAYDALGVYFVSMLNEQQSTTFGVDCILALVFSLNIISFLLIGKKITLFSNRSSDVIKKIASYTFSLYLYHMPLLFFVSAIAPFEETPVINLMGCLVVTPFIIYILGTVTERKKKVFQTVFRRYLIQLFPHLAQ